MHETLTIAQILLFGVLVFTAFVSGKICQRIGLSETAGQIVGGILVGPSFLKIVDYMMTKFDAGQSILGQAETSLENLHRVALDGFEFYLPVYMGMVLFTITEECHMDRIKECGKFSFLTSFMHTFFTFFLVLTGLHYLIDLPMFISVVLAAVASSSSPASALVSMCRRQVEGRLKTVWAQTTTLDALIELILFTVILLIFASETSFAKPDFRTFVRFAGITLAIGVGAFFLIRTAAQNKLISDEFSEKTDNDKLVTLLSSDSIPTTTVLIIVWSAIFLCVGSALVFKVPFTIAVIIAGLLISNYHSQYIFDSLKIPDLMRVFHLLFFALIGSRFDFQVFGDVQNLKIICVYLLFRTLGKLLGTWIPCRFFDKKGRLSNSLPYLFLPNMGATGISLIVVGTFLNEKLTETLMAILPAMLIFEVVGASMVDQILKKWKKVQTQERSEKKEQQAGVTPQEVELVSFDNLIQERVIIDIDVLTKEDAIKMMCAELLKYGNISELQNILSLVLEREKLCSTGLGDEVALPHCRTSDVEYPMAVCAFLGDGESIDWDSPDGQGVRYIFLLVSPLHDPNMHIEAMKSITSKIMQPGYLLELYSKHKNTETT